MSFQVSPDLLSSYGQLLDRAGQHQAGVNAHFSQYMVLTDTSGAWIQTIVDAHDALVARTAEALSHGRNVLDASASELTKTAEYYRSTDQTSAANLDATYPGSARPPVDPPGETATQAPGGNPHGANHDVENPLRSVRCPETPAEFSEGPLKILSVAGDFISPSWWINEAINFVWGFNPLEYVTRHVAGDWESFARCALVWEQLGNATDAIGKNVHNGLTWVSDGWQGNAADAAVGYFDHTQQALASTGELFHEYYRVYYDVASDVWLGAKSIADLLKVASDKLISVGLKLLSAKALSPTGVGAQILWGLVAYDIFRLLNLWSDVLDVVGKVQLVVAGFAAFALTPTPDTINRLKALRMPANEYNHPGVA